MKTMHVFPTFCLGHRGRTVAMLACAMAFGCGSAFAQSTGNATIYVTGSIIGPTCSLSTSNITIPIGTVKKSVFTYVGSFSPWSSSIPLISAGCNAGLVSMTFTGTAAPGNTALFAVTGGATGVGIRLSKADYVSYAVPNSTSSPVTFTPAAAGEAYSFVARYEQTSATVTTGTANATITVLITYI